MTELRVFESDRALACGVSDHVVTCLNRAVGERGWASLALSGGASLRPVLDELCVLQARWDKVEFFFTDERGVRPEHPASNYGEALDRLFTNPRVELHQVHRIEGEGSDLDAVAELYERELPSRLDVAVVGLEPDGAFAALHPDSVAFDDERAVVPVEVKKKPHRRVTLAPPVFDAVDELCVVAQGRDVAAAVSRALEQDGSARECPARLVRRGTWFLDRAAAGQLAG